MEEEILETHEPPLIGDSHWIRKDADAFCPNSVPLSGDFPPVYCGVAMMIEMVFDGDHPPCDTKLQAKCWSCGQLFHVSWDMEPVWSSFKITETEDE